LQKKKKKIIDVKLTIKAREINFLKKKSGTKKDGRGNLAAVAG
jgi:hypothetical protein